MKDQFKCKGCGAPRSYPHQYCPNCESTGPHIPVERTRTRIPSFKVKINPDKPWWGDIGPDEGTPVKKRKETREKETVWSPPQERQAHTTTGNDRDMRSLWVTGPPAKKVSGDTWKYVAAIAVAALAIVAIAIIVVPIIQKGISSFETNPTPVATTNNTDNKPDTAGTPSQNNTQTPAVSPAENTTVTRPEPVEDTVAPELLGEPSAQVSDTTVTISWETDEKATAMVRYGTNISYTFPSAETGKINTNHSIYLTSLLPETTYHFQVISTDESGNTLTSGDYTFKTESATDEGPYTGSKAPDFTLKTLDGTDVSLSQFRGKKVVLNFWASWCTPCKVEMPHLQATWDKLQSNGDFVLVTVAGSQSEEALIRSHIADNGYTFIVLLDPNDSVFNRYQIVSIPRTYFIDKGGIIRRIQQGMFTSPGEVEFMLTSY